MNISINFTRSIGNHWLRNSPIKGSTYRFYSSSTTPTLIQLQKPLNINYKISKSPTKGLLVSNTKSINSIFNQSTIAHKGLLIQPKRFYSTEANKPKPEQPINNNKNETDDHDEEKMQEELKKLSMTQKIKFILKRYGKLALIVHFSIYFATLGGFTLLLSAGVDPKEILDFLHLPQTQTTENLGVFAIAFILTKISSLIRTPITIITVPFLARLLKPKVPPPKIK
ncbi:hypothetical protein DLAC_09737 [Tieghemostelium lacteum]|uniref:DUF1279 domain-containing protein n=1 Tax=Tieghemostelium lacteum TaxID=361077 RepID=A0A151Z756_TIELA|nr:hypothetical protein DLAC_09737 [Tieghemostelium lacteum]|eukprot:KYQ89768.1 hypothetical protein DLAC_09737 [Tieghemostelium lacteum]